MPEFPSPIQDLIDDLRALYLAGTTIETYELAKVNWPSPTDPIWYSTSIPSEIVASLPVEVDPLEVRILADSLPDSFIPVKQGDEIGDETVDLKFWDGPDDAGANDGAFGDLLFLHGEGIKIELYYWFPQVELLLRVWHGHLRNEEEADPPYFPVKAVQGFRSSESTMPSGGHYEWCSAVFGGLLATQAEIDENGCPYNFHIGGGIGNNNPDTAAPWTFCNRRDHASCTDRAVNPLFHLSHLDIAVTIPNGQTHGPLLYSTTVGNQTNLSEPVCVVLGVRRVTGELLRFRRDLNNNHPDQGFFFTLNELCRGPVQSFSQPQVIIGGTTFSAANYIQAIRLGTFGQTIPNNLTTLTTHGFSNIALFGSSGGQLNPAKVGPQDVVSSAIVTGLSNIRVYSDEDTFTEIYTTNPAWHLARMLCDKIWGYGLDYELLDIQMFIDAAAWCDDFVRFTDINGDIWDHQRSTSNVELRGKKVQQHIEDFCRSHRLSLPFLFNGKICIVPLRALTEDELDACPEFTDEGTAPNIVHEGDREKGEERSTLRISRQSSFDLPNRIEISYDKAADDWQETPIRPVEDIDAQLAGGRSEGTTTRKIEPKKFNLLGVTNEPEAMKMAQALLDLGEFDRGGLMNNCAPSFTAWYIDTLDLHPEKVIKITNTKLQARYGFTHFRVKSMERQADLKVKITTQAYPVEYMATGFEINFADLPGPDPDDPVPPSPPDPDPPPFPPFPPGSTPPGGRGPILVNFVDGILIIQ